MFGIGRTTKQEDGTTITEYCTSSFPGSFSTDIRKVAQFAQEKTAISKLKAIVKYNQVTDYEEYFTFEIVISESNRRVHTIKRKEGYQVTCTYNDEFDKTYVYYYYGAKLPKGKTYGTYQFTSISQSATLFETADDALQCINRIVENLTKMIEHEKSRVQDGYSDYFFMSYTNDLERILNAKIEKV